MIPSSSSETFTTEPAEARPVKAKNATNYTTSVDPNSETLQFTVVDQILLQIQRLKQGVPDLATELGEFHDFVANKGAETIADEDEGAKETRLARIAGAAEVVLDSVTGLLSRPFKAKQVLEKASDKFNHYMNQQGPKGRDPQGIERKKQKHITDKYKN